MINSSEPEVLKYYIGKRIDIIKDNSIDRLSKEDIALLKTPMLKKLKEELKPKFASSLTSGGESLTIDNFETGAVGKFVSLYGLDDLFKSLPDTLKQFQILNRNNPGLIIQIPEDIAEKCEISLPQIWLSSAPWLLFPKYFNIS